MKALRVGALLLLAACSSPTVPDTDGVDERITEVRSDKLRDTTPDATAAELAEAARGQRELGFDLYRRLRGKTQGNFFLSPASVSLALAMTWAGAAGGTFDAMSATLHYSLAEPRQHAAFNALDLALASRGQGAGGVGGHPFRLAIANSLWGRQGYVFESAFLDVLATSYGAGLRLLDFAGDAEGSRQAINGWVAQQTEGRIPELFPSGAIQPDTRLVLTNTIYFNAAWLLQFPPSRSAPAPFHLLDGTTADVKTMRVEGSFPTASGAGWKAIELPYEGGELSMLLVVPDAGSFAAVEAGLDDAFFSGVVAALAPAHAMLALPAWKNESKFSLKEQLAALGMGVAFGDAADFSRMNGGREGLAIMDVLHQANVEVTEGGTVASAATGVIVGPTSVPEAVDVNRPFFYAIRDVATGAVVFLGRVTDPREQTTSL